MKLKETATFMSAAERPKLSIIQKIISHYTLENILYSSKSFVYTNKYTEDACDTTAWRLK